MKECSRTGDPERNMKIVKVMDYVRGNMELRLLRLNGRWDAYWQERRKELARFAA